MARCCPPGSWPALEAQRTTAAWMGRVQDLGGGDDGDGAVQAYVVRPPPPSSSSSAKTATTPTTTVKAVILSFQDIYAYDSARHWSVADQLALDTGCPVVHVDWTGNSPYSGGDFSDLGPWVRERPFDSFVRPKLLNVVLPYVRREFGADCRIATVGYCWGAYLALQACADDNLKNAGGIAAAVHFHPSFKLHGFFVDASDPECLAVARRAAAAGTPHLLVAAGNDPPSVGPDGSVIEILQAARPSSSSSRAVLFRDMMHGFVNRGDVSDAAVRDGVKAALETAVQFLKEQLLKLE